MQPQSSNKPQSTAIRSNKCV